MFTLAVNFREFDKSIEKLEQSMITTVKDVVIPGYFQQLQRIAAEATALARIRIKLATTPSGIARARSGSGQPGRIDTGAFYKGLSWRVRKEAKGAYSIRIGWLDGDPDYASYQELGFQHRSGMYVTGADALGEAHRYVENEIAKLK